MSGQIHFSAVLPPGERASHIYWIGGWVGLQSRSGRYGEVKVLDPTGSRPPTPQIF
jgi:hypothetical protein